MFTPTPKVKNLACALLPDTFTAIDPFEYNMPVDEERFSRVQRSRALNPEYGRFTRKASIYVVAGYWHEINMKAGKHVASYGEFMFDISHEALAEAGLNPKTARYEEILELKPKPTLYSNSVGKTGYLKIGHAKPWSRNVEQRGLRDLLNQQYDATSHQNMLINPNELPRNADGWYLMNKSV